MSLILYYVSTFFLLNGRYFLWIGGSSKNATNQQLYLVILFGYSGGGCELVHRNQTSCLSSPVGLEHIIFTSSTFIFLVGDDVPVDN